MGTAACQISGAAGVRHAGVVSEDVHPMFMFLLETPATLALPAPFLDPDSLPTHEASPSLPPLLFSSLPCRPWQLGAEVALALRGCWAEVEINAPSVRDSTAGSNTL